MKYAILKKTAPELGQSFFFIYVQCKISENSQFEKFELGGSRRYSIIIFDIMLKCIFMETATRKIEFSSFCIA